MSYPESDEIVTTFEIYNTDNIESFPPVAATECRYYLHIHPK
ncbi:hypothetical protein [Desulforegula conservatrix]|nr:hypothetical protein [Desulforegula conservatrix]